MRDALVVGALLLSFATFVTTHVVIGLRLMWRVRPWHQGLVALLVPPVGLWRAFAQRWRVLAGLWLGALGVYVAALIAAAW